MARHLNAIRRDQDLAQAIVASGLCRIGERHTCAHRIDELLAILTTIAAPRGAAE
jgi:spore maturation protein CgeB